MDVRDKPESLWPSAAGGRPASDFLDDLTAVLWMHKLAIVATAFVAVVVALVLSFVLPKSYTVTTSFVPAKAQGAQLSSGLASLAGQLGATGGTFSDSPEFYSRLLNSQSLLREVLSEPPASDMLFSYLGLTAGRDSLSVATRMLARTYSVSVDRLPGIVRLNVTMRDATLARVFAETMLRKVDSFNSEIRRDRARERAGFFADQASVASQNLDGAERDLEGFLQKNSNLNSPKLEYEKTKLERRIQVAQDLFVGLSRQLQTARLDELDNTPAISIIDSPFVPDRPSAPRRALMMVVAAVGAGFLSALSVLIRHRRPRGAPRVSGSQLAG